ncbi:ATP-dependent zinc protease family protein [Marinospirillum perlucidum]|uniref:ATP-dependent zinc protease family protein n=1 Tax=Marinospirillum perlucidum TaxID=1982602 RepID=UPI000DF48CC6|nr:RimK/LysX family protein [Marinospirillum perlucidum]
MTHKTRWMPLPQVDGWLIIGARERVFFPDHDFWVKAKVDTGAKTSSLHARDLQVEVRGQQQWVNFYTFQDKEGTEEIAMSLPVYDKRWVRSSNGAETQRYVVHLLLRLGELERKVEVTLADRSQMKYPMLLGRTALEEGILVAPGVRYLLNTH